MKIFRRFFFFLCAVSLGCISYAQEKVVKREVLSLDKGWRFHQGDIPFPVIKGHNETESECQGRACKRSCFNWL